MLGLYSFYICDLCSKISASKSNCRRHMQTIHNEKRERFVSQIFFIDIMFKNSPQLISYRRSSRRDQGRVTHCVIPFFQECDVCGGKNDFTSIWNMKWHRRIHNLPIGPTKEEERKRVKQERYDQVSADHEKSVSKNVNHVEIMYWLAHLGAYAVHVIALRSLWRTF